MSFKKAVEMVLHHEGGLVDDKHDRGGLTNYGISQKAYPEVDIKALTKRSATDIYKRDYWFKSSCQFLPSSVAIFVFDTAVNMGNSRAAKFLQECSNCTKDGIIGDNTIRAVHRAYDGSEEAFLHKYKTLRLDHYRKLDTFHRFGRGWTRRAEEVLEEAKKWIDKS
jgi:lysozyme family protein